MGEFAFKNIKNKAKKKKKHENVKMKKKETTVFGVVNFQPTVYSMKNKNQQNL